ncbi:cycloisomerase [Aurantimonas sp. 22II-16-19i]|uniref:cycloisomerase n=1 Tax=Aurantimonas sp. 22II-16-19i TaxID=1317114 RepID=UPI0009F7C571|nr:cycloisomerase [Aurantimonas sp. 22II-16-19i]ORE97418.1 putative cycloisomerase [Aurantimonas sp. 22II-16-19i]
MQRIPHLAATALLVAGAIVPALAGEPAEMQSETVATYTIPEANQAVGVDATHFYAIDNRTIAKYDKATQTLVKTFERPKGGAVKHFDSASVVDGKIYVAHSNYPEWPMTSSLEIFDAETLDHVESHSFGIQLGSFTWVDKGPDGAWYGAFANYNRVFGKSPLAYGNKYNTQVVKFDADWQPSQAWIFPDAIVDTFDDMSNSGGSFGPDGNLYISGHDEPEAYVMALPEFGSVLEWKATVPLANRGQGIAWDRSTGDTIYAIIRGKGEEENKVTVNRVMFEQPAKEAGASSSDEAAETAPAK